MPVGISNQIPAQPSQTYTATNQASPYVPKLTGTSAARLSALLESLTGLLDQAVGKKDALGASAGLADLVESASAEELALLLDSSMKAQSLLQQLQEALQEALNRPDTQALDNQRQLILALSQIREIYHERSLRRLKGDWDYLWQMLYRDQYGAEETEELVLPSLPPGLSLSMTQGRVANDPGQVDALLNRLLEDKSLSHGQQALLLDAAHDHLLGEIAQLNPEDTAQIETALATGEKLAQALMHLRTQIA